MGRGDWTVKQLLPQVSRGGGRRAGPCLELTHQGDDEGEDVQQPVQNFGGAFGLIPEDAVNQQGWWAVRKGMSGH